MNVKNIESVIIKSFIAGYLRNETGVRQGDDISIFYDPMIAKLVVWGKDRLQCTQKLSYSLQNFKIAGLVNNVAFLKTIIDHDDFKKWDYDTSFIKKYEVLLLSFNPFLISYRILYSTET